MKNRALQKLEERFNSGEYYEAHLLYRSIYSRLLNERKYSEIYDLLYNGAMRLFDKGEHNSGADLANLIVDTMCKVDSCLQLNHSEDEIIDNIRSLFAKMVPNSPERLQFVSKALKIPYISTAEVRRNFAEVLWKEKNYAESRNHFIHSSDNGKSSSSMLIEYQTQHAYPHEYDLFIAQFVFQVLCIENVNLAQSTFICYSLYHPDIKCRDPPFTSPLLNFIYFLIQTIIVFRGNSQMFEVLCHLYEKSLNRDPSYKDYLQHIGQIYFGVEKKSNNGVLFTNLLQSLFESLPEDGSNQQISNYNSSNILSDRNQEYDLD